MNGKQVRLFVAGALAAMLLSFLDENIVTSAAWQITRHLDPAHGLDRLPWLVTAYVLAATASQPLYGKFCDLYGPKPVYLFAVCVFLLGSSACGLAQSMGELIAFRAVQGLGGGGLMSVTLIIIATLLPARSRTSGAGLGGGLVALGIVAGPLLGGFLCQYLSWRWIFYVNLPLGLMTIVGTVFGLRMPERERGEQRVDVLGAALVTAGATALLLLARWGGGTYAWTSPVILTLGAAAVLLVVVFCWWQTRAADPILPMSLFTDPVFRVAAPLQFVGGFTVLAVPVFVVTYLQVARGVSAQASGIRLAPMAIGVLVVMMVSGRLIPRFGRFKPVLVVNASVAVVALALFGLIRADTTSLTVGLLLIPLGFGLGGVVQVVLQTAQAAAPEDRLGVVTSGTRFFMTLGSAFGTALLGEVLSHRLTALAPGGMPGPGHARNQVYASATSTTFLVAAGVMVLGLLLALAMPDVAFDASDGADDADSADAPAGDASGAAEQPVGSAAPHDRTEPAVQAA
ncbi:MFS transporter [Streptomyces sp. L2]|uniref:MFS transporter n=1 Tax=Streptomyces sp. L2 TaxID=2162665 RepID=UPI001010C027|nr:MFS transporter [Streptomyces sp. L2]